MEQYKYSSLKWVLEMLQLLAQAISNISQSFQIKQWITWTNRLTTLHSPFIVTRFSQNYPITKLSTWWATKFMFKNLTFYVVSNLKAISPIQMTTFWKEYSTLTLMMFTTILKKGPTVEFLNRVVRNPASPNKADNLNLRLCCSNLIPDRNLRV